MQRQLKDMFTVQDEIDAFKKYILLWSTSKQLLIIISPKKKILDMEIYRYINLKQILKITI